jgi:hypothetical protein
MIQINLFNSSANQYRLPLVKAALKEFIGMKEENKKNIQLYAYCHESNADVWEDMLSMVVANGIEAMLVSMPSDRYLEKVAVAHQSTAEYTCKWDDDVFINRYVWDFLIENVHMLEDPTVSVLAPTLSNGMPSVELFIKDFLTEEETSIAHKILLKDNINPSMFGCNYESVYNAVKNATEWDGEAYWKMMDEINPTKDRTGLPWFYTIVKGVHPARFSYDYNMFLANHAIANVDTILKKGDHYFDRYITPYFCNNLFISTTEFYVSSQELFFDHWDEGQMTMLANRRDQRPMYVRNCYGIQMAYGCTDRQREIEEYYLTNLFAKLA